MNDDLISRQAAIDEAYEIIIDGQKFEVVQVETLMGLPSAQPQDIARDIATIIENEKDMRVMLQQRWIPVSKEEMFKAGYEGREIRFRVDGRLFAIRELAQ